MREQSEICLMIRHQTILSEEAQLAQNIVVSIGFPPPVPCSLLYLFSYARSMSEIAGCFNILGSILQARTISDKFRLMQYYGVRQYHRDYDRILSM
jgi:hypothetical protein